MRLRLLTFLCLASFLMAFAQREAPADSLDREAAECSLSGDDGEAVRLAREAVALRAAQEGEHTSAYARSAGRLAKYLSYIGRQKEAIEWGTKSLAVTEELSGTESADYAQGLSDMAGFHSRNGNYQEALALGTRAMDLRLRLLGAEHPDYAQSLNNLARYHSYLGNVMEAVRTGRKAVELKEKISGKNSPDYAQSVSNLAGYLSRMGNYGEAIRLGQEALHIRERVLGNHHPDYAQSLNNLAKYHFFLGDYTEAIALEQRALAIREDLYGKQHPEYATALANLADYYLKTGSTADALRCAGEALQIREAVVGDRHPDYAESLAGLAECHFANGNVAEAVALQERALALQQQVLGEEHPAYAQSLCKMAAYYSANGQQEQAEAYAFRATGQYTKVILNTFADLTSAERDLYWMKVKPWFTRTILQLTEQHPSAKMMAGAYNGTLLAKGLLLKSEQEMVSLLMESGDSVAVGAYRRLQADRALLLRLFETPRGERMLSTDSLQRVITKQERRLVKRSKAYGSYTAPLRVEWNDIARMLRPGDIAVEFVHYPSSLGEGRYAALVIAYQSAHPVFIPLMSDRQMEAVSPKEYYTGGRLSQLVWQPLEDYLKKAKRVFFAPAGELYNIGVESLPLWQGEEGEVMSDRWDLYRLSSTREIVLSRANGKNVPPRSATIFGGMLYDAPAGGDAQPAAKQKGGAKYLPATKKEAGEIYRDFTENNIPANLNIGESATEKAFKQLSGHATAILHVATHGFYWTDSEVREGGMDKKLQFLSMYGNLDDADKALTRSGLLFTGANRALRGDSLQGRGDDGILTAKEISLLDLRGLRLLVLSACQTGLGKVTGDGVFGLQRGFKKAGAQTLLMSLWKVDDAATRLLMSRFYHYLMQGTGKHEALRRAQQDLRNMDVENGGRRSRRAITSRGKRARLNSVKKLYNDPYYWAAFILLDGIE